MLVDGLDECGINGADKEAWLKIDKAFRATILRKKEDCKTLARGLSTKDMGIISIPKPPGLGGRKAA